MLRGYLAWTIGGSVLWSEKEEPSRSFLSQAIFSVDLVYAATFSRQLLKQSVDNNSSTYQNSKEVINFLLTREGDSLFRF